MTPLEILTVRIKYLIFHYRGSSVCCQMVHDKNTTERQNENVDLFMYWHNNNLHANNKHGTRNIGTGSSVEVLVEKGKQLQECGSGLDIQQNHNNV